jgi:hypothetical protein
MGAHTGVARGGAEPDKNAGDRSDLQDQMADVNDLVTLATSEMGTAALEKSGIFCKMS